MCLVSKATIKDTIGLAIFRYTAEARSPPLEPHIEAYHLRMVEDDCEPDMDLPAVDEIQRLSKFHFDSYCVCKNPAYVAPNNVSQVPVLSYVRVYYADNGCTILKRQLDRSTTVGDILEQTLKRRMLRTGLEYTLERKKKPGHELNVAVKLSTLDPTADHPGVLEFLLIRKHSKRRNSEVMSSSQGLTKNLQSFLPKTYSLFKYNRYSPNQAVDMLLDQEKATLCMGRNVVQGQKLTVILYEHITNCEFMDEKRCIFRITTVEGKHDFEAKSDDSLEIVSKLVFSAKLKFAINQVLRPKKKV